MSHPPLFSVFYDDSCHIVWKLTNDPWNVLTLCGVKSWDPERTLRPWSDIDCSLCRSRYIEMHQTLVGCWDAFLKARAAYLKSMRDEGKRPRDMIDACNLLDERHVLAILEATSK